MIINLKRTYKCSILHTLKIVNKMETIYNSMPNLVISIKMIVKDAKKCKEDNSIHYAQIINHKIPAQVSLVQINHLLHK